MPIKELYREVAQYIIRKEQSLGIFHMLGPTTQVEGLPSWVPDWSMPQNVALSIKPLTFALEQTYTNTKHSDNPNALILASGKLGSVVWAGQVVGTKSDIETTECSQKLRKERLLHSLDSAVRYWILKRGKTEVNGGRPGETKGESFWRSIVANKTGNLQDTTGHYELCFMAWADRIGLQLDSLGAFNITYPSLNTHASEPLDLNLLRLLLQTNLFHTNLSSPFSITSRNPKWFNSR